VVKFVRITYLQS